MALKEANKEAKEKQYLKKYREIKAEYQTDTRKYMHALEEEVTRLTKLKEKNQAEADAYTKRAKAHQEAITFFEEKISAVWGALEQARSGNFAKPQQQNNNA